MMKRKWICILMVVVMMLSFASCGGAYGWEDDTTPDAPSTKTSESKDPNSNNPTVDVTDENLEKKECDIRVLSSDIWSWERRLSGIVAVIRSKDALGSLLLEDLSDVQLGTFELYCDDYEAEFFTESTLVLYAASSSSCCLPWIPKAEMVYDEEGNDWLRLHVDNVSNHYVHNEDDRQLLYLVEVSTTEIDAVDDVEIIFGDYEVPEKPDMPVINQKGEPIAFQNIETLADYIYEYNYKQYEEQFRRSYQSMMKTIRKAGYLYSVDVQNAEIVDDGITIFPGGLDYGYDLGYAYLIEKDDVLYQVMI